MKRIKIRNGRMKFNKKIFALRTRLKGRMKMEQKKTEEIFKIKKIKSKSSKRMKKKKKKWVNLFAEKISVRNISGFDL